jgi:hypothetical protein
LWLSTNLGYRFFAEKLPSKADAVYRDPSMLAANQLDACSPAIPIHDSACGLASAANP